jgi:hypothetical protein
VHNAFPANVRVISCCETGKYGFQFICRELGRWKARVLLYVCLHSRDWMHHMFFVAAIILSLSQVLLLSQTCLNAPVYERMILLNFLLPFSLISHGLIGSECFSCVFEKETDTFV